MNKIAIRLHHLPRAFFALLLLAAISAAAAHAQTGIYGAFSASKFNFPTDQWGYGATFGVYSDFYKVPTGTIRAGTDLRGSVLRPDSNTNLFSVLIGPRLAVHPHVVPLTPYVEGLIGAGHYSFGNNLGSRTKLEYQLLGGVDHTLVPHLDWRIIEFSYGGLSTFTHEDLHPKTLSTGLVLRLP